MSILLYVHFVVCVNIIEGKLLYSKKGEPFGLCQRNGSTRKVTNILHIKTRTLFCYFPRATSPVPGQRQRHSSQNTELSSRMLGPVMAIPVVLVRTYSPLFGNIVVKNRTEHQESRTFIKN